MKNPFPGVNPFIESEGFWADFHGTFVPCLREALLERLPSGYDARIDERIELIEPDQSGQVRKPDVSVIKSPSGFEAFAVAGEGSVAVLSEPMTYVEPMPLEASREIWIEVVDQKDGSVVTSIELLSPTNKSGIGHEVYRHKRAQVSEAGVHLVDIDLLLSGQRLAFRQPLPEADFYAFVARRERRPKVAVYGWRLEEACPQLPIPLRSPDANVGVDLQAVFDQTFERGQYRRRLKYDRSIDRLDEGTNRWARELAGSSWRQLKDPQLLGNEPRP